MKRAMAMLVLAVLLLIPALWAADAWARAGGGSSSGSRGSRSYSAPASPSTSPSSRPSTPASSYQQPAPQRSGWGAGLGGMLGGLVLGGLIGSLLFGGMGHLGGGGIGLLEIAIVGALVYFGFSYMRRRQQAVAAGPAGYADPQSAPPSWKPEPTSRSAAVLDAPGAGAVDTDLTRGIAHIRQMDPGFDPARFGEMASDVFFRLQGAWMTRDMGGMRGALTEEMYKTLQAQCDQLRAERRVNRLENIAVRSVEPTETWQEEGRDFVTVRFLANLLDYTTDESGTQLVDGNRTEPVKFEEFWTFTRPVGPGAWRLSAIQQA
jgi:predicted lipid-binding transport protein (Tim44 family)